MTENMDSKNPTYHRTYSLDAYFSLRRMESRRLRRQQFLENIAKFNNVPPPPNVAPPPVPTPRTSLQTVIQNESNISSSPTNLPRYLPSDKVYNTNTSTVEPSISSIINENEVQNTVPYMRQQSRQSEMNELIQRFTSELLSDDVHNEEVQDKTIDPVSPEYQKNKQISEKPFMTSKYENCDTSQNTNAYFTHSLQPELKHSTLYEEKIIPSVTTATLERDEKFQQTSDMRPEIGDGVTLLRPSYFLKNSDVNNASNARPITHQPNITNTNWDDIDSSYHNRSNSLQHPSMAIPDYEVLQSTRIVRKFHVSTMAIPFKPPNWVRLPEKNPEETDSPSEYPSWLPLNTENAAPSFQSTSSAVSTLQQNQTRRSALHVSPVTETRSQVMSTDSLASSSNNNAQRQKSEWRGHISTSGRIIEQPQEVPSASLPSSTTTTTNLDTPLPRVGIRNDIDQSRISPNQNVQNSRRYSTSAVPTFPRRSLTPSYPVKSLVKKFSSNN